MASIISWMELAEVDKPSFVVNTAAATVAVTVPATPFLKAAGTLLREFSAADSILILEYGIKMPECFEWTQRAGDGLPKFTTGWARASDGANLTTLTSQFTVPVPNQVTDLKGSQYEGLFLPHYSLAYPDPGVAGKLLWRMSPMNISMVGVPDSLNGVTQYLEPWVKIQHQIAIS